MLVPFCGSGTTLGSAELLERKYIGVDINPDAAALTRERLENPVKTDSISLKVGAGAYETKTDEDFDCDVVQRNKGMDALLKKYYENKPVALKIQKENEALEYAVELLYSATVRRTSVIQY